MKLPRVHKTFIDILSVVTDPAKEWPDRGIRDAREYIADELMKSADKGDMQRAGCPEEIVELRQRVFTAANRGTSDPFTLLMELVDHPWWTS